MNRLGETPDLLDLLVSVFDQLGGRLSLECFEGLENVFGNPLRYSFRVAVGAAERFMDYIVNDLEAFQIGSRQLKRLGRPRKIFRSEFSVLAP